MLCFAVNTRTQERVKCRGLLDSGSSLCLVQRRLAETLNLDQVECTLEISLAAGQSSKLSQESEVEIQLASLSGDFISPVIRAVTTKSCIDPLPKIQLDPRQYPQLARIPFTESYPQKVDSSIQLLVDSNTTLSLLLPNPCLSPIQFEGPKPLKTRLGWVLAGQDDTGSYQNFTQPKIVASVKEGCQGCKLNRDPEITAIFKRFYDMEDLGIKLTTASKYTAEEEAALSMMKRGTIYCEKERRFFVPLLFKLDPKTHLDSHWKVSFALAQNSRRKAIKAGAIKEVDAALGQMVSMGAAEKVPESELRNKHVHYLPTLAVMQKHSKTTRVRLTQNASSQCRITKKSLNDILMNGPVAEYMPPLIDVLIRFRLRATILMTDVSKEFWEIYVNKTDRDWQRFLYSSENSETPTVYRQKGLVMGAVSSPFQALYCIEQLGERFKNEFPLAYEAIQSIYVDDICADFRNDEEAAEGANQLIELFKRCSMKIHKFRASNERILDLAKIEPEKRAQGRITKFMGVQWQAEDDTIEFDYTEQIEDIKGVITKRKMAKLIASIWDPLGACSPVTFSAKVMIRTAWQLQIGWDEPVSGPLLDEFLTWKSELHDLKHIKQPRLILPKGGNKPSLFMTCDASILGVGINAYVVSGNERNFLYSRTRVAPLKSMENKETNCTIVRLELLALVLAGRCATYIKELMGKEFFHECLFFSDSLVNIGRVRRATPLAYKQWVSTRLQEVEKHMKPSQLFHISGVRNPSDLCSRGTSVKNLIDNELWLHGPSYWSRPKKEWPPEVALSKERAAELERLDKAECKAQVSTVAAAAKVKYYFRTHLTLTQLIDKSSNFGRLNRTLAYIFRFIVTKIPQCASKMKIFANACPGQKGTLTVPELRRATAFLLRTEQRAAYEKDLEEKEGRLVPKKSSQLVQMAAFEDPIGVWRVVTRLDNSKLLPEGTRRPILLPKTELVMKYILYLHQINGHITLSNCFYFLQRQYWVAGGRKQVQKCLRQCRVPNCQRPRQLQSVMPALPSTRTDANEYSAYTIVGMDHFGPVLFKADPNNKSGNCEECEKVVLKSWGLIFVCFQTRHIHVQLCRSANTEDFLWAMAAFCSIRGTPTKILADNAKVFRSGSREVYRIYRNLKWDKIQDEMAQRSITFEWSTERMPQTNSVTERMIQFVKKSLSTTLAATSNLKFEHLQAIINNATLWINDRPLFAQSECYEESDIVTPSLLVHGRFLSALPFDNEARVNDGLPFSRMMIYRRTLAHKYFRCWKKLYLHGMLACKWAKKGEDPPLKIDQIVMYNVDSGLKQRYSIGRIVDLIRSKNDNQIRKVALRISSGSTILRHVNQISILEADVPSEKDRIAAAEKAAAAVAEENSDESAPSPPPLPPSPSAEPETAEQTDGEQSKRRRGRSRTRR